MIMDARQLIEIVKNIEEGGGDYYALAAQIAAAQKEADASLAEQMGASSVAAAIRVSA